MIDIKLLREQPDLVKVASKQKNAGVTAADIDKLLELDAARRREQEKIDSLRNRRNLLSDQLKAGKPSAQQIDEGRKLKEQIAKLEADFRKLDEEFLDIFKKVPNIPTKDVPVGASEDENVVAKTVGDKPEFEFEPKNHWQLAEPWGWIDKERAAKVAGSRFAYVKGDLVKLHFALINFALQTLTNQGELATIAKEAKLEVDTKPFTPVLPPLMIRTEAYDAMDRLEPREERYQIEGEDLWLQGSAEHVLGSMHIDEIIPEAAFPVRYVGYATSFRREAGSYGKDMEGIFRMHQFDKLEMESLTLPEESLNEHLFMIAIQEHLMQKLELPYQVILKCTADIGKPNARGVDIDVWLPGQGRYRETHTADYMTDYQARRLGTRVRRGSGEVELVHTNDATALSQRPLIAIIENFQTADGKVGIPKALQQYFGSEFLT